VPLSHSCCESLAKLVSSLPVQHHCHVMRRLGGDSDAGRKVLGRMAAGRDPQNALVSKSTSCLRVPGCSWRPLLETICGVSALGIQELRFRMPLPTKHKACSCTS